jgi:hypothetical protein
MPPSTNAKHQVEGRQLSQSAKGRLERSLVRSLRRGRARKPPSRWWTVAGAVTLVIVFGSVVAADIGPPLVGCVVKGNISFDTDERIYHVPGQEYYSATRIDWLKGERWFCSEEAARAAGWRRAGR